MAKLVRRRLVVRGLGLNVNLVFCRRHIREQDFHYTKYIMYCSGHLKGLSAHVTTNVFVLVLGFVPCCVVIYIMLTVFMFSIGIYSTVYDIHLCSIVLYYSTS